jgi:hypothetical protein
MYTELLGLALIERSRSDVAPAIGGIFAELLRCRARLPVGKGGALASSADQLAYDVALVRLAEGHGIGWELRSFEHPAQERRALEGALTARGVPWLA